MEYFFHLSGIIFSLTQSQFREEQFQWKPERRKNNLKLSELELELEFWLHPTVSLVVQCTILLYI